MLLAIELTSRLDRLKLDDICEWVELPCRCTFAKTEKSCWLCWPYCCGGMWWCCECDMLLLTLAVGESSPVVEEERLLLPGQWLERELSVDVLLLLFCRLGLMPGDFRDRSGHLRDWRETQIIWRYELIR